MLPHDFTAKLLDMEHLNILDVEHSATSITITVEMQIPGSSKKTLIVGHG